MCAKLRLDVGDMDSGLRGADRLVAIAERQGLDMFNEWDLTTEKFEKETCEELHVEKRGDWPE